MERHDGTLGPCLWDAFGLLAIHAQRHVEEIVAGEEEFEVLTRIISFGCATLLGVVNKSRLQSDEQYHIIPSLANAESIAICKAVLFFLFSSSVSISSIAKHDLEDHLQKHGYDWLPLFVSRLSLTFSSIAASEGVSTIINLIALCVLSKLECCHEKLVERGVLEILSNAIKVHSAESCPSQYSTMRSQLFAPDIALCCWTGDVEWEGQDHILFFCLWAFSGLACGSDIAKATNTALKKQFSLNLNWKSMPDEELGIHLIRLVSSRTASAGLRWWASCCLASCGAYGFPSERNRLSKLFGDPSSADLKMVFGDGSHFYAHKVIIVTKCPDLMPTSLKDEIKSPSHQMTGAKIEQWGDAMELRFSQHIHKAAMLSLLEFIYKGIIFLEDNLVLEVKKLAKRCCMDSLWRLLEGKVPVGNTFPDACDISMALGDTGCVFSDIVLEDKDGCQAGCNSTVEGGSHQHAHRMVLSSQCSYFEGLFRSGMQDSASQIIRLPLSVEAIQLFLRYMYTMFVPCMGLPQSGCMWIWAPRSEKLKYLEPYVELSQVGEQWLLEDMKQQCLTIVQRHIVQSPYLGLEIMKLAATCKQWDLIELIVDSISVDYTKMRENGELDALDDYLVDAIRIAHVKKSMSC